MIEMLSTLAKLTSDEQIMLIFKDAFKEIELHGITKSTKGNLAAVCQLFLVKMAMGEEDLFTFIDEIKRRQTLAKAFDNKQ